MDMARLTGLGHNSIGRLERGEFQPDPARLGRILSHFVPEASELLGPDFYERLIPADDFGGWLRNFRLRNGLRQDELARALGLHKVTVCRYEKGAAKPAAEVVKRLKRRYKLTDQIDRYFE